jgi:hypothetical protein
MQEDLVFLVLGTHTHFAGEWMVGYRYMVMDMEGSRDGTRSLSDNDVLASFPITPTRMSMQMHMLDLMYAPSDKLTLMLMQPFISMEMDHVTRTGARFTTESEGAGDLKFMVTWTAWQDKQHKHRLLLTGGISIPTGSIDEEDNTPLGVQRLPYPMQLGSGTFDLRPGLSYLGEAEQWAWGGEFKNVIRLDENSNQYRLGNRYEVSAWVNRKLLDWLGAHTRIDSHWWGNIKGADPQLNPALVPTADPGRRAGERVDLLFGLDLYAPKGKLKNHRLSIEGGLPVYQSLDGPQLEVDWLLTGGWLWTF